MDKINELQKKLTDFQAKSAAKEEIKTFVTLVLQVLKSSKDNFDKLTSENLQIIKDSIAFIEENNAKWLDIQDTKSNATLSQMEGKMNELKALIAKIKTIKAPVKGVDYFDGENPTPESVVPLVLSKIPKVEPFILKRLDVVQEINLGKKDDLKIEYTQISGLDKLGKDIETRALSILDQRTQFLINKTVKHDTTLTGDGTDANPLSAPGDVTATWGSITGTLSNQTDLQTALNAKQDTLTGLTASVTELNYTDGVTSAIQTQFTGKLGTGLALLLTGGTMTGGITNSTSINPLTTLAESWIGPSSTAGVYFKGGNVGIGTMGPTQTLDVNGVSRFRSGTELSINQDNIVNAYYSGGWKYRATGFAADSYVNATGDFLWLTAPSGSADATPVTLSEKMRILNNGNVGIGTTDPGGNKLEIYNGPFQVDNSGVNGPLGDSIFFANTSYLTSYRNKIQSSVSQSSGDGKLIFSLAVTSAQNFADVLTLLNNGNVGIGETAPGGKLSVLGGVAIGSSTTYSQAAVTSGNLIIQGNVGIGTTTPGQILTIQKDNSWIQLDKSSTSVYNGIVNSVGGVNKWFQGMREVGNTGNATNRYSFYNFTNGAEQMVIQENGNVGIGTSTPTLAKLQVAGSIAILETGATPTKYSIFQGGDQTVDITYTLPPTVGGAGTQLTDVAGNGVLTWEAAGGGASAVLTAKVSLTSAQILALYDTPVELIAAPGAGKVIQLIANASRLNYGSADYLISGSNPSLQNPTGNSQGLISTLNSPVSVIFSETLTPTTMIANEAMNLYIDTANPTTGDSTLDIYLTYRIITL
jgi:hypothetical protein